SSRGDRPAHQKISRPNTLTPQNGWRFGEEPPTRGEILFDQVIVLPENNKCSGITTCSNKHAIGFSNHKHTPITTTRKNARVHWVYHFRFVSPTRCPDAWTKPCLSWSDPVETLSCRRCFRRGNEI